VERRLCGHALHQPLGVRGPSNRAACAHISGFRAFAPPAPALAPATPEDNNTQRSCPAVSKGMAGDVWRHGPCWWVMLGPMATVMRGSTVPDG